MPFEEKTSTATVEDAITALANLGVTGSASIGSNHDPDLIIAWCRWAEECRQGGQQIGTGLVVSNIRGGERPPTRFASSKATVTERKRAEQRARFRELALPFPPGSVCETHADAEMRRRANALVGGIFDDLFPEDEVDEMPTTPSAIDLCAGELVVVDRGGMILSAICDACRQTIGYPLRALGVLPRTPLAIGRAIPSTLAPKPPPGGWFRGEEGELRKLDPTAALRAAGVVGA